MRGVILILIYGSLITTPLFASEQLDEANATFTYKGKAIHPGLVQEFSSWISDPGLPTTISIDVAAPHGNEYLEDDVTIGDGKNVCIDTKDSNRKKDGGFFCYEWLGKIDNGLHVLKVAESGGGSGVFEDLFFVKFDKGKGYADDGKKYDRLLMSIVRQFGLGDRYDGKIEILADRVRIHPSEHQFADGASNKEVEVTFPGDKP